MTTGEAGMLDAGESGWLSICEALSDVPVSLDLDPNHLASANVYSSSLSLFGSAAMQAGKK